MSIKKEWSSPLIQVLAISTTATTVADINFDSTTESAVQIVIDPNAVSQTTTYSTIETS